MEPSKLEQRKLGSTGLSVSPIGLGTVKFGRNEGVKYPAAFELPDDYTLTRLLSQAKDLGINVLDTAPAYGTSEERLGTLLKGQRRDWVIVGKAGEEFKNGKSSYDFTPKHFIQSLERSLKRLQTDYIDVLLIHSDGSDLDILGNDDLLEKMRDFKRAGMVRAIGASTKTVKGGLKAVELLDVVMATYRPDYTDEKEVLDRAAQAGKGVLLKKVLASGHSVDVKKTFDFVFEHPAVSCAVIGTVNPAHMEENVKACLK